MVLVDGWSNAGVGKRALSISGKGLKCWVTIGRFWPVGVDVGLWVSVGGFGHWLAAVGC